MIASGGEGAASDALTSMLQSPAGGAALAADGVHPETIVLLAKS